MSISYSLGQAPARTERPAPAPPEKKEQVDEQEMNISDTETSSDDDNPDRRARYPPTVKIGHYLNPKTGRWCKTSGRVYNKMLNKNLGVDSMFPPLRKTEVTPAPPPPPKPAPVDIWSRYGF